MKKIYKIAVILNFIIWTGYSNSLAISPYFSWVKAITGGMIIGNSRDIAIDKYGNSYVVGSFLNRRLNETDFDPGPGTHALSSHGGSSCAFVAKYNTQGNLIWAQQIGDSSTIHSSAFGIAIHDTAIYITGEFKLTVDFDPGSRIVSLVANEMDMFVLKLDLNGNYIWAKGIGGSASFFSGESGHDICVDRAGKVLITGLFGKTVDFDPGPAVNNITASGDTDAFILKLESNGDFIWAKSVGGDYSTIIQANSICVDNNNNILVAGWFYGPADFNPGPAVDIRPFVDQQDVFVLKLDANGNYLWAQTIGGYSSDIGNGITTDNSGAIFVTGEFQDVVDFDPGMDTTTLTSNGNSDIFILKLNAQGDFDWVKTYGSFNNDVGNDIIVRNNGEIVTTGYFTDTADFNPGSIVGNKLYSIQGNAIFLLSLESTDGTFLWAESIGGQAIGTSIAEDEDKNLLLTGQFEGSVDFDYSSDAAPIVSMSADNFFILKLGCSNYNDIYTSECDSFTFNGLTYKASGIYRNTFSNISGCDSLVTLYLDLVGTSYDTTHIVSVCDSFIFNGKHLFRSGNYVDTFLKTVGCDSIIRLTLSINNSDTTFLSITTCDSFVLNDSIYTLTGDYIQSFSNSLNCDSIVHLELEIKGVSPRATVVKNGKNLIAGNASKYQWVDCNDNFSPVPGATAQTYSPTQNGSFAVVVFANSGCSDTSDCLLFEFPNSINELENSDKIILYPNPTEGITSLKSHKKILGGSIELSDIWGRVLIKDEHLTGYDFVMDIAPYNPGIYFIKLSQENKITTFKIVKK